MDGALNVFAWFIGLTLVFNGWPHFFTINIHKHYGPKDKQQ